MHPAGLNPAPSPNVFSGPGETFPSEGWSPWIKVPAVTSRHPALSPLVPPRAPFGDMGTPGPWGRGTGAVRPGRNFQSQKAPGKEKLRRADTVPTELPGGGAVGFQLPCPPPPPLLPGDVGSGFCPAGGSGEPPPTPEPTPSPFRPHFVPISRPQTGLAPSSGGGGQPAASPPLSHPLPLLFFIF